MVTRRKRRQPQGYRDGGRVVLDDTMIAEDAAPALAEPPAASPPEDDGNPLGRALASQRRAEELQHRHQAPPQAPQLPEVAQAWLSKHPEFVQDQALNGKLGVLHHYLTVVDGIEPFSPEYFDAVDRKLGFAPAAAARQAAPEPPARRSMPVSAPVSRDVPMSNGQRQPLGRESLTRDEVQIAHASFPNLSEREAEMQYIRNRRLMNEMKRDGAIG